MRGQSETETAAYLPRRRRIHNQRKFCNVTFIDKQPSTVKPVIGEHERDFLTKAINSAISRARLQVNALEVIGASLRHKQSSVLEARDWLKTEGLEPLVARYLKAGTS